MYDNIPYKIFHMSDYLLQNALKVIGTFHYEREFINDINTFVQGNLLPKVLILYGVRRTGKTTAMLQSILHLSQEEQKKVVFFQVRSPQKKGERIISGDSLWDLQHDIEHLLKAGKKYFYIDEATRLLDFQRGADVLADVLALCGAKIILSGTDSLCLDDARKKALLGRADIISTSHITYQEWSAICENNHLDDFAKFGGILGDGKQIQALIGTEHDCKAYIQSAYANNLQHSIQERRHTNIPQEILDLADENRLEGAIQRVVSNLNHRITAKILRKNTSLSFIGSLRDLITKDVIRAKEKGFTVSEYISKLIQKSVMNSIDEKQILQWMSLCFRMYDESVQNSNFTIDHKKPIDENVAQYLENELIRLHVIKPFLVRKVQDDGTIIDEKRNLLVQHGLIFCQEKTMVECLANDPMFASLFKMDKDSLLKRMEQDVLGHIVEEIVLLDTVKYMHDSDEKIRVFTLGLPFGEIDLAVLDHDNKKISLYEIKHSSEISLQYQALHLKNEEMMKLVQKAFGNVVIVKKSVLINNPTIKQKILNNDIIYEDISSFLCRLSKNPIETIFLNDIT